MAKSDVTVETLRRSSRQRLIAVGIESADLDTKILICEAFGWNATELITRAHEPVTGDNRIHFERLLARRINHEPIAYIVGKQPFWSLEFSVTPDVLIPRPETEGVVAHGLELIKNAKAPVIVDVGTGSGAILLSLLNERKDAEGFGLDISDQALEVAKLNAKRLDLADRAHFVNSDYLSAYGGKADLIVSNPPYITDKAMTELPSTVAAYEPELALRGGSDGLRAYQEIMADISRVLAPNGFVVFEIGYDQGAAVASLLEGHGFHRVSVEQDLAGHNRVVSGKLSV